MNERLTTAPHLANISKNTTLLQHPENTRPTAREGCMVTSDNTRHRCPQSSLNTRTVPRTGFLQKL